MYADKKESFVKQKTPFQVDGAGIAKVKFSPLALASFLYGITLLLKVSLQGEEVFLTVF